MMINMKKAWYIEGYQMGGAIYCRNCFAETMNDESLSDPYCQDEVSGWVPIFASDVSSDELEDMYCEYCFETLDTTNSM